MEPYNVNGTCIDKPLTGSSNTLYYHLVWKMDDGSIKHEDNVTIDKYYQYKVGERYIFTEYKFK